MYHSVDMCNTPPNLSLTDITISMLLRLSAVWAHRERWNQILSCEELHPTELRCRFWSDSRLPSGQGLCCFCRRMFDDLEDCWPLKSTIWCLCWVYFMVKDCQLEWTKLWLQVVNTARCMSQSQAPKRRGALILLADWHTLRVQQSWGSYLQKIQTTLWREKWHHVFWIYWDSNLAWRLFSESSGRWKFRSRNHSPCGDCANLCRTPALFFGLHNSHNGTGIRQGHPEYARAYLMLVLACCETMCNLVYVQTLNFR